MCCGNPVEMSSQTCWRTSFDFYELIFLLIAQSVVFASILAAKSSVGYSGKSQFLYSLAFAIRYFNPLTWDHSPTHLCVFKVLHYLSIFITSVVILDIYRKNDKSDSFRVGLMFFACSVLAIFVNTGSDIWPYLWCLSIYLEAVAVLPQTHIKSGSRSSVNVLTFYFTFMSVYKVVHFASLLYGRSDGNYTDAEKIDMAGSGIQLILYSDFFWRDYRFTSSERNDQKVYVLSMPDDVESRSTRNVTELPTVKIDEKMENKGDERIRY